MKGTTSLTPQQVDTYRLALIALRRRAVLGSVPDVSLGICYNLKRVSAMNSGRAYAFVEDFAKGWPDHTGETSFPVPCRQWNKWMGESLRLRLSLIDYMLAQSDCDCAE